MPVGVVLLPRRSGTLSSSLCMRQQIRNLYSYLPRIPRAQHLCGLSRIHPRYDGGGVNSFCRHWVLWIQSLTFPVYTGLKSLLRTNLNFSEWIPSGMRFLAGLARGFFLFLDISGHMSRHHKRRLLNDLITNDETHTKHSWMWWKPFYLRFAMAASPLYIVQRRNLKMSDFTTLL